MGRALANIVKVGWSERAIRIERMNKSSGSISLGSTAIAASHGTGQMFQAMTGITKVQKSNTKSAAKAEPLYQRHKRRPIMREPGEDCDVCGRRSR